MEPVKEATLAERLFNVHTVKAIGAALASFGLLSASDVQQAVDGSGGSVVMLALGILGYVAANIWRKA